ITLLLDAMGIPYTGNSTAALVATASKISVKERLQSAGLPTPTWLRTNEDGTGCFNPKSEIRNPKFILKSVHEHASFELDDRSVVSTTGSEQLIQLLPEREASTRRAYFAEEFIEGREFNLSLLGDE